MVAQAVGLPGYLLGRMVSFRMVCVLGGLAPSVVAISPLALDSADGGHSLVTKHIPISLMLVKRGEKKNLPVF